MAHDKPYTCIVVDDELLARQLIEFHISQTPQLELVHSFSSCAEVQLFLNTQTVDVLFLDIQMPTISGIDCLKQLKNPLKVIFTTAFSEFALEGYELNIIDYLVKPITAERFNKAVLKVTEQLNLERELSAHSNSDQETILIKSNHQLVTVQLNEILYIESLHKYVKIVTKTEKHITLIGISTIEKELSPLQFYRCHRSFIINLKAVERIEGTSVIIGNSVIPISKLSKSELKRKLGKSIS